MNVSEQLHSYDALRLFKKSPRRTRYRWSWRWLTWCYVGPCP